MRWPERKRQSTLCLAFPRLLGSRFNQTFESILSTQAVHCRSGCNTTRGSRVVNGNAPCSQLAVPSPGTSSWPFSRCISTCLRCTSLNSLSLAYTHRYHCSDSDQRFNFRLPVKFGVRGERCLPTSTEPDRACVAYADVFKTHCS